VVTNLREEILGARHLLARPLRCIGRDRHESSVGRWV
jgi:hypothetical protein